MPPWRSVDGSRLRGVVATRYVAPGRRSQPAPTVNLDEYCATVAEDWMGVPASEVLLAPAAPLPGIFT